MAVGKAIAAPRSMLCGILLTSRSFMQVLANCLVEQQLHGQASKGQSFLGLTLLRLPQLSGKAPVSVLLLKFKPCNCTSN